MKNNGIPKIPGLEEAQEIITNFSDKEERAEFFRRAREQSIKDQLNGKLVCRNFVNTIPTLGRYSFITRIR